MKVDSLINELLIAQQDCDLITYRKITSVFFFLGIFSRKPILLFLSKNTENTELVYFSYPSSKERSVPFARDNRAIRVYDCAPFLSPSLSLSQTPLAVRALQER